MSALPPDLQRALTTVAATPRLLVTSDFDGTLAPIVDNPADARPLPAAADALVTLSGLPATTTALISGRALATLRALSALPATVHLVGSHGAEFDTTSTTGARTGFAHDIDRDLLQRITDGLAAIADGKPGVTVETKPASVALHVRNAAPADGEAALAAAWDASSGWGAHVTTGKAVLEFAVITTDKGEAVDVLRGEHGASAVVFFGDDVTDEKAFVRLGEADVGVKVGPGETAATYRIDSPEDVAEALQYLAQRRAALA